MNKEKLIKYLNFRLKEWIIVDKYFQLLGDISIYNVIDEADEIINELLDIDEDTEQLILDCISDYALNGKHKFGNNLEKLADYILTKREE